MVEVLTEVLLEFVATLGVVLSEMGKLLLRVVCSDVAVAALSKDPTAAEVKIYVVVLLRRDIVDVIGTVEVVAIWHGPSVSLMSSSAM